MPTPTKYTFSISTDFPNSKIFSDRLTKEIGVSSIVTAIERIDTVSDDCDIWFKDILSEDDETTLNSLVSIHSGEPFPNAALDTNGNQIISLASTTTAGLAAVTVQNFGDTLSSYRRSWLIECLPQTITLRDICVSNDLVGGTGICQVVSSFFGVACDTEHPNGAALGSQLQVDLIDRDNVLGYFIYYGAQRSKLNNLTNVTGTFQVGEEIRGTTCRAKVLGVGSDYLEVTFDRWNSIGEIDTFAANDVITGQASGATATLDATPFTEGDFLFLQTFIKSEALYRFKAHEQKPGGSRSVPPGLYFRCAVYNSHATDSIWIDGSIDIGKM